MSITDSSGCTLILLQICSYKRLSSSRNSWKRLWQVRVSGNWLYCWTEWISVFRTLVENWWIHKSANKRSRWKKINYMGLSELMRMIIIFVTFCLNNNKKKSLKDSEAKNIQINFHCKVKELLQWRITGLNVNIMT